MPAATPAPWQRRLVFVPFFLLTILPWVAAGVTPQDGGGGGAGGGGSQESRFPCTPPQNSYLFCNTSLPVPVRARAIVAQLLLDEKIQLLSDKAAAVRRLGLPAYEWWSESLHGLAPNGPGVKFGGPVPAATVFPQVIVQAAAFNRTLWREVAGAVAVEARAMYNVGQAGLTFWAPNVNIFRDPRWGRGQETPGEDPMLTSSFAVEYVQGFQGEGPPRTGLDGAGADVVNGEKRSLRSAPSDRAGDGGSPLMLSACCKHYTAYDLESWGNFSRYSFNAQVTEQDMRDTYQPPFQSCIRDGGASCLMCSYNAVNGVPACASRELLQIAREQWGFQGYIASDCNAVATIFEYQGYVGTPEDAVADALKAGVDINCGGYYTTYTASAITQGKVQKTDVDRALVNLFSVQLRLGLFDGDPTNKQFGRLGPQDVCTAEHRRLALEAARQGIVLLKNNKGFLPLKASNVTSLAVIGPAAKSSNSTTIGGGYTGTPCNPKSIYDGLQAFVRQASFASGCLDVPCVDDHGFDEAVRIAREADAVVVVAGIDLTQENEDHDRVSLLLPGKQADLVSAVAAASKLPIVLVLMGGGPLDISFAKKNLRVGSILWVGYPGEAGEQAVAEAIFGQLNPGGRLPLTWYPESFTDVPMNDMHMRPDPSRGYPGRTYRFYTGEVVYGFGHGLSYSKYSYKFVSAPNKVILPARAGEGNPGAAVTGPRDGVEFVYVDKIGSCEALRFPVVVSVVNQGEMDGSHAILLFSTTTSGVSPSTAGARKPRQQMGGGAPQRQLIGFQRVHTARGGAATAEIVVDPCKHLSTVDKGGRRVLSLGEHTLSLSTMLQGWEEEALEPSNPQHTLLIEASSLL
ncbi:hypothetical protein Taro_020122 [Colocasia esculenta]|uniref:Fibronectin type III-like domain-containing protein n=1 Tax=Colocasia esculenta TaxID=4460 RepID=A0A843UVM3_COLES|nr:hypothetical protein [Colocasia esculenta]